MPSTKKLKEKNPPPEPRPYLEPKCPTCGSTRIVKFGRTKVGTQRYSCRNKDCEIDTFQMDYIYIGSERCSYKPPRVQMKIYNVRPLEA